MKSKLASKVKDFKRELILQEASRYFEEVGFENVKMNELAKNCDISVGQLYKLFDSKENMFLEHVRYQITLFHEELKKACNNVDSPKERLLIYLKLKFDIFKNRKRTLGDLVVGDPLFFMKLNSKNQDLTKPIFLFLSKEFEKLSVEYKIEEELDFLQVAYLFNSFSTGYVEYWLSSTQKELNVNIEDILNRFIVGFTCKGNR